MPQRTLIYSLVGSACLIAGAALAEAQRIDLSHATILSDRLPSNFDGFTIAHLSDLHMTQFGRLEGSTTRTLSRLSPDVVVATGDLAVTASGVEPLCKVMSDAPSALGKFAVFGNAEHQMPDVAKLTAEALPGCDVRLLGNENVRIERRGETIVIAGVDDPFTGHADLAKALSGVAPTVFVILLAHSPQIAAQAVEAGVDLVLSGHTHGGQFKLPYLPPPYAHLGGGPTLVAGMYEGERLSRLLGRDAGHTRVYVSRGIGTSNVPGRLFCRPELPVYTLKST